MILFYIKFFRKKLVYIHHYFQTSDQKEGTMSITTKVMGFLSYLVDKVIRLFVELVILTIEVFYVSKDSLPSLLH